MVRAAAWVFVALCASYLAVASFIYLSLGQIEADDVYW